MSTMTPINPAQDSLLAYQGRWPSRVPHYEHWSCPDAETYLSGIDFYEHPRLCRQRLQELYPQLRLPVPGSDEPVARPESQVAAAQASQEFVRWGAGISWEWDWGCRFQSTEEVLAFSPLEHPDFTDIPVVESRDYSDEEKLYQEYRRWFPWDQVPQDRDVIASFYNTLFMWPLLTFGWERFLEISLEPEFGRIIDEFAELSKRVFRTFARLPVNVVICHDDIVGTNGPFCSPEWMHRHIFPHYEEYWSILKGAGKRVIFMTDGNVDRYADDIFACGADGISTEPYTDFKAIAKKHPDCVLQGEGDNRILTSRDPERIRRMVDEMVETSKMTGGYFMSVGNHIPWDIPPESIKLYLDYSAERAVR